MMFQRAKKKPFKLDLAEMHAVCEANYARLLRLFPDYQNTNARHFSGGVESPNNSTNFTRKLSCQLLYSWAEFPRYNMDNSALPTASTSPLPNGSTKRYGQKWPEWLPRTWCAGKVPWR